MSQCLHRCLQILVKPSVLTLQVEIPLSITEGLFISYCKHDYILWIIYIIMSYLNNLQIV